MSLEPDNTEPRHRAPLVAEGGHDCDSARHDSGRIAAGSFGWI